MAQFAPKTKPTKPKSRSSIKETAKSRSTIKETTPTGHEQETEYIIPGRLSQHQWNAMLIQEDADEIVGEVMDKLLGNVMDRCYQVYIERQLVPYSASWAGKYLTQNVEQLFCLNAEERPEELTKTEDSEPMAATPDSGAQGCFPVVQASNQPQCTSQQEFDEDQVPVQIEPSVKKESPVKQVEKERRPNTPFSGPACVVPCPHPPAKTNRKEEQGNKRPPKKVPVKVQPSLSSSVTKNNEEVKSNSTDDTAFKDKATSVYLENSRPIPKLDPSRLPQRYIFPEYEIVDPIKPTPKRHGGLPRLEPKSDKSLKPPVSSKDQPKMLQKRSENNVCLSEDEKEREASGSLRSDMKVLAKSVSLLDSRAVKGSPVKLVYPSESTKMMPIRSDVSVPMFSVDQVTAGPPPRVTPLIQTVADSEDASSCFRHE
ncbi:uncharacterized protein C2orf81 homolog [Austrofundulus limnaeus]|uniref:Uncharacterized protein C2orf81 homolog n=1 Tax=Austrofundulus limnaeus TaxID=52670 RepID=A0A2I4B7P0_AUSLI|nr:PREDICTED: uncharacterized protein C2orf81 homolog [Austrofundulus limnaeus]